MPPTRAIPSRRVPVLAVAWGVIYPYGFAGPSSGRAPFMTQSERTESKRLPAIGSREDGVDYEGMVNMNRPPGNWSLVGSVMQYSLNRGP